MKAVTAPHFQLASGSQGELSRRIRTSLIGLSWVAVAMITGCVSPSGGNQALATSDGGTSQGQDAAATDSGAHDVGSKDAGGADATATDAGTTDASTTDAGVTDAGVTDAGGTDAGTTDAGTTVGTFPVVVIETTLGTLEVELNDAKAPISVANFLTYVDKKFYDGVLFHRVIANFMVQGGGVATDGTPKTPDTPIKNEAGNGLLNLRGSVAMARTNQIDSASSQFFINHKDNSFLDHKDNTTKGFGYAVFGKVTAGMDVVDKIAAVKTTGKSGSPADKPLTDVVVTSIRRK